MLQWTIPEVTKWTGLPPPWLVVRVLENGHWVPPTLGILSLPIFPDHPTPPSQDAGLEELSAA